MPIIKSYLLPHSPLLIPEIAKANHSLMAKTSSVYETISSDLKENKIETIIVFSPHNNPQLEYFILNCAPEMDVSFQDFGFIPKKTSFKGAISLSDKIRNSLKDSFPLRLLSEPNLDYGSGIPLYLIKELNESVRVLSIGSAEDLSLEEHYDFGLALGDILEESENRIALIVSGDLSHRLMRKSPAGHSPKGPKFDNKIIEFLSYPDTAIENILAMDKKLIADASECGLKPITLALGTLAKHKWQADILAYQTDFGIGYLSLEFVLSKD